MKLTVEDSTPAEVERVVGAAHAAAEELAETPADVRAAWLDALAAALVAEEDLLVDLARAETHLAEDRLRGELARTAFQTTLFARRLRDRSLLDIRIDPADDSWGPVGRPDIRRVPRGIGPVLVYAASNFPFAFSVAGGDSVSALAAGCPVIVKAHDGHRELSAATGRVVADALAAEGALDGTFGVLFGREPGLLALRDSRIKAAGFTGSVAGGRALFDIAMARDEPIPFYGELGSTNPVVITPAAWQERAHVLVDGFVASMTLGSGQFCTSPGVVFVPDADAFAARARLPMIGRMLNDRIAHGFAESVASLGAQPGVRVILEGNPGPDSVKPTLLATTADELIARSELAEMECFGPAALLVEYGDDLDAVIRALEVVRGQLTGTVHASEAADGFAPRVLRSLVAKVGRVIWNQWPTGVVVTDAQQHGGPYPATTAPTTTSVGTAAVSRFLRPVAYQNVPVDLLPVEARGPL